MAPAGTMISKSVVPVETSAMDVVASLTACVAAVMLTISPVAQRRR
jgi:hypothetical protein